MKLVLSGLVQRKWPEIKAGFNRELFLTLTPPLVNIQVERFDGCAPGDEVHVTVKAFGLKQKWISHITTSKESESEWSFVDQGHKIPWPLKFWRHHHRVVASAEGSSLIIDDIEYHCFSPWMEPLLYPALWAAFAIRPMRYKEFFEGK